MRDYNDPKYKAWRLAVKRRDKFKCKKCGSRKKLAAHHIKKWADHPLLRYDVNNGITLCRKCHEMMSGQEEAFEQLCILLLNPKKYVNVKYLLWKMKEEEKEKEDEEENEL